MILRREISILFICIILLLSCIFDANNEETDDDFIYPLKVGNRWDYIREWNLYYYGDTTFVKGYADTVRFSYNGYSSVIDKVDLDNHYNLYKVIGVEYEEAEAYTLICYYKNTADGLYMYAYEMAGGPNILPKKSSRSGVYFKGIHFDSFNQLSHYIQLNTPSYTINSDSITFEEPPLKTIQYPIEIGDQWTYREPNKPWRMDRVVVSREYLNIEMGEFDCYTLKFIYEIDDDGEWDGDIWMTDYISRQGLVKRETYFLGITETTVDNPVEMGRKLDAIDTYTLTGYKLK